MGTDEYFVILAKGGICCSTFIVCCGRMPCVPHFSLSFHFPCDYLEDKGLTGKWKVEAEVDSDDDSNKDEDINMAKKPPATPKIPKTPRLLPRMVKLMNLLIKSSHR